MKDNINKILSGITGYHLAKSGKDKVTELFASKWINSLGIKTVIDVGANAGQFAKSVRMAMPNVKIISFEPIPLEYKNLINQFKGDKNFESYQYALGDTEIETEFELNEFSPTSSLLEFTDAQKEYYPVTGENKKIKVQVKRLDKLIMPDSIEKNICLKVDVQGFEDKVLLGASALLDRVVFIYVECSFKEFYKGQPLFDDIYKLLTSRGFVFQGVGDQLNTGLKGEPTQIDAFFINSKLLNQA